MINRLEESRKAVAESRAHFPASLPRSRRIGLVAVSLLVGCALLMAAGVQIAAAAHTSHQQVQVLDGKGQTHFFPLNTNATYTFRTSLGVNEIEVIDGSVTMISADCPGHDCVEQETIHDSSHIIVCMPHKLIISIVDKEE